MTKVTFYMQDENTPFAYFPDEKYYHETAGGVDNRMRTSYHHIGQHSACHPDYLEFKKEAQFNEYSDLLRELIGQGYNDLQIMNKQEIEYHRPPTKAEIIFGEGVTHYATFNLSGVLNKKWEIKKWVLSKYENLRYYR